MINQFDSNIDSDIAPSSFAVKQLEAKLETKLETITKKLEQIERAMASGRYNNTRPRRQLHSYLQPQVEYQPRSNKGLAPGLGISPQSLILEREKLTAKEFISCRVTVTL